MYSPQNDSTSDCGAAMISTNRTLSVSNITNTNKVDTDVNNDDNSNNFSAPGKFNHNATGILDTKTTTSQGKIKVHPHLCQSSISTPTSSFKKPPSEK